MEVAVELITYAVVAAAFTVLGVVVEFHSYLQYATGEPTVALWLAGIGGLLLYAGLYLVGYEKLLRTLTA